MAEIVFSLDRTSAAPREARLHVRDPDLVAPRRIADAELLVSELVTNAVKYGPEHEQIRLIIASDGDRTRFTVHDDGRGPLPEMRAEDDPAPGGHGLRLVDALADRWGVERGSTHGNACQVLAPRWFELDR